MSDTLQRLRILISDDDPMICEVLREVLEAEPDLDVVAVAQDADEAIDLAARHTPNVAVLDMRMPGGGGARAAREIRRQSPVTRILAFSAYADQGAVTDMAHAGAAEYLLKGVPNDAIVAAVRRLGRGNGNDGDGDGDK
jgi:DNA-binding NarL/FixJ family response regulator